MSKVIVLLLASGQEIIGRFARSNGQYSAADDLGVNNTITLEKVRVIAPIHHQDGRIQVSLVPYVFSNIDTNVHISTDHVVGVPLEASDAMEREYLSQTSGLQLASA